MKFLESSQLDVASKASLKVLLSNDSMVEVKVLFAGD